MTSCLPRSQFVSLMSKIYENAKVLTSEVCNYQKSNHQTLRMQLWGQFLVQHLRKLQLPPTMVVYTKEWNDLFIVATSRLVIFEC